MYDTLSRTKCTENVYNMLNILQISGIFVTIFWYNSSLKKPTAYTAMNYASQFLWVTGHGHRIAMNLDDSWCYQNLSFLRFIGKNMKLGLKQKKKNVNTRNVNWTNRTRKFFSSDFRLFFLFKSQLDIIRKLGSKITVCIFKFTLYQK